MTREAGYSPAQKNLSPTACKLRERPLAILHFVHDFTQQHGYMPTIREIGHGAAISSTSVVNYHLERLARSGYIQRTGGTSRTILLLEAGYRIIGQPMPNELQTEQAQLLVENRRLREQCEALQRECDRLRSAAAHLTPTATGS